MAKVIIQTNEIRYHGVKYDFIRFNAGGVEVAQYNHYTRTLFVRTDLIGCDFDKPVAVRAGASRYAAEYKEVLEFMDGYAGGGFGSLKRGERTPRGIRISEYMRA